jgi:hypothetical protein
MPAAAIHEFLPSKNSKPENGTDAVFQPRKGLKRYPFLLEAKKIQAESPVRERRRADAPKKNLYA